jgi:hypothetical protein
MHDTWSTFKGVMLRTHGYADGEYV